MVEPPPPKKKKSYYPNDAYALGTDCSTVLLHFVLRGIYCNKYYPITYLE